MAPDQYIDPRYICKDIRLDEQQEPFDRLFDDGFDPVFGIGSYAGSTTEVSATAESEAADPTRATSLFSSDVFNAQTPNYREDEDKLVIETAPDYDARPDQVPFPELPNDELPRPPFLPFGFDLSTRKSRRQGRSQPRPIISRNPSNALLSPEWRGRQARGEFGPQGPRSYRAAGSRTRIVEDRRKVAKVREVKSCRRCKILKVACDSEDNCPKCRTWEPSITERVCTRKTLDATLQDGGAVERRWLTPKVEQYSMPTNDLISSDIQPFDVSFAETDGQPPLRVHLCTFATGSNTWELGLLTDSYPDTGQMYAWAKAQLGFGNDFPAAIEAFLVSLAGARLPQKQSLVQEVLKISAMWCVLKARNLWIRGGNSGTNMPCPLLVQIQLKRFAQREMAAVEQGILKMMDDLVPDGVKYPEDRPAIWAALWRMILLYRQALEICDPEARPRTYAEALISDDRPRTYAAALAGGGGSPRPIQYQCNFIKVTRQLLDGFIVMLSAHFRTSAMQSSISAPDEGKEHQCEWPFRDDPFIRSSFEAAREARFAFYEGLRNGQRRNVLSDDILISHVIEYEGKVTSRKKRAKRATIVVDS